APMTISVSFHEPAGWDGWLLYSHESTQVGAGMSYVRGTVHTEAGELIASFTQDALSRPPRKIGAAIEEQARVARGGAPLHRFAGQCGGLFDPGRQQTVVGLVVRADVEVAHLRMSGRLRRHRLQRGAAEELQLHVVRVAAEGQEPAVAVGMSVERLVPF